VICRFLRSVAETRTPPRATTHSMKRLRAFSMFCEKSNHLDVGSKESEPPSMITRESPAVRESRDVIVRTSINPPPIRTSDHS
jgi:hypothetical protein